MIDSSRCPPEKVVVEYAAGRLDGEALVAFQQHMAECAKCKDAMEWVQFHFFAQDTDGNLAEISETRSLVQTDLEDDSATSNVLDAERFDISLLKPTNNPAALGRLGGYDVLELIGFGGMGVVFKAYDERLRRVVAIKALNRSLSCSSTARRRFIREARAAGQISHPNVVTIHSVDEQQDQPFLVMEYIEGSSLRDRLRKESRLDPIPTLRISTQVAEGLAAAHRVGIVHRDVKPANIMLEDGLERVKITDFGLARAAVDNVELTSREMAVGTPAYMAPEQVRGEKIDTRADLFALGCVMYAMLVGHSPFHGRSSLEMARKVSDEDPTPPHQLNDRIPGFLSEIIMRLLEKNPDRRFQSAAEVADLLKSHLTVLNQTPTDELSTVLYGQPKSRRNLFWGGVSAAAILSIGLIAFGIYWANRPIDGQSQVPSAPSAAAGSPTSKDLVVGKITVAKSVQADYSSLAEALQHAAPGATIEILDDGTYEETIHLDRSEQWTGVKIVGHDERPPTLTSQGEIILSIWNTPDVVLRGLRFRTTSKRQHAIQVRGKSAGTILENIDVVAEGEDEYAMIYITAQARVRPTIPFASWGRESVPRVWVLLYKANRRWLCHTSTSSGIAFRVRAFICNSIAVCNRCAPPATCSRVAMVSHSVWPRTTNAVTYCWRTTLSFSVIPGWTFALLHLK